MLEQIISGPLRDVIVAAGLVTVAWITERARRAARSAGDAAEQAATYSRPTGNGFAGRVTSALERLELGQQRVEEELADHRDQQNLARAEHAELRAADRTTGEQLHRVERLIRDHLNEGTNE